MAMATDGIDGPTDAAGAIVNGQTAPTARALGLDPETSLEQNDAYALLKAANSLLVIGPTGTNLNDIVVGLSYR
jgi:hydroxypyruvate reductase